MCLLYFSMAVGRLHIGLTGRLPPCACCTFQWQWADYTLVWQVDSPRVLVVLFNGSGPTTRWSDRSTPPMCLLYFSMAVGRLHVGLTGRLPPCACCSFQWQWADWWSSGLTGRLPPCACCSFQWQWADYTLVWQVDSPHVLVVLFNGSGPTTRWSDRSTPPVCLLYFSMAVGRLHVGLTGRLPPCACCTFQWQWADYTLVWQVDSPHVLVVLFNGSGPTTRWSDRSTPPVCLL